MGRSQAKTIFKKTNRPEQRKIKHEPHKHKQPHENERTASQKDANLKLKIIN